MADEQEQAIQAALQALNDAPDELHSDITPAVMTLAAIGPAAVPGLLERLLDPDELTRLRAQRALEHILYRQHGFRMGRGFPSPQAEQQARAEWRANGDYRYDADSASRTAAVERWREWAAAQGGSREP